MHYSGARAAIIEATSVFLTRPGWDYSYRPQDDKRIKAHHKKRAEDNLNFSLPGKERRGRRAANNLPMMLDLIQAGQVLKAVDTQPEPVKSWLYFAYGAFWDKEHIIKCHSKLMEFCKNNDKRQLYSQIASIALEDMKHRLNTGKAVYKQKVVCELVGVLEPNYSKTIKPKMEPMKDLIATWNAEGLHEVKKVLNLMQDTD